MVERCSQEMKISKVVWSKPSNNIYKLNTDGNVLGNPGKIGGGGILRDSQGRMIYAFAVPLGTGTNNQVELQAAIQGL